MICYVNDDGYASCYVVVMVNYVGDPLIVNSWNVNAIDADDENASAGDESVSVCVIWNADCDHVNANAICGCANHFYCACPWTAYRSWDQSLLR